MGASAPALEHRLPGLETKPLRLLQGWHLLSLDAPTVALCWSLLFASTVHVPHPWQSAVALAGAVWLIYAGDRLLDARCWLRSAEDPSASSALCRPYLRHARKFFLAGVPVGVGTGLLLLELPRGLREDWLLLSIPLLGYAIAVHVLGLPSRWKAMCVSLFFGLAAALPAAVQSGVHAPLCLGALAFGCVCRLNCQVLRPASPRLVALATLSTGTALLLLPWREVHPIAAGCLLSIAALLALRWNRARLSPLTYRALADAALTVPVLVLLAR